MMRRDTDRHQRDMLLAGAWKSLLMIREHLPRYQRKITWLSVQDIDIKQHGFKLGRD
jgi:hypothetical protein